MCYRAARFLTGQLQWSTSVKSSGRAAREHRPLVHFHSPVNRHVPSNSVIWSQIDELRGSNHNLFQTLCVLIIKRHKDFDILEWITHCQLALWFFLSFSRAWRNICNNMCVFLCRSCVYSSMMMPPSCLCTRRSHPWWRSRRLRCNPSWGTRLRITPLQDIQFLPFQVK